MGKGGSSSYSVDTSAISNAAQQETALANQAAQLAQQNYALGQGMYTGYEQPVLNEYMNILGLGSQGQQAQQFLNPALSQLAQPGLQAGQQAETAAVKNLMNSSLGPGQMQTAKTQLDLSKMGNVQNTILSQLQPMLQQLIGAGQQGTALMGQAPGQVTGAAQAVGQAGSLDATIAQLQAQAAMANNLSTQQGLGSLSTLFGMLGAGGIGQGVNALGSFGGKGGSAGAGSGSQAAGLGGSSSSPGGYEALLQQAMSAAPLALGALAFF